MDLSIVILAYGEEENLRQLLPKVRRYMSKIEIRYEMIVIDAAKPVDKSQNVCRINQAKYINQKYPGFGGALKTGVEEASGTYILTMDGDGSHDPINIEDMLTLFLNEDYDVVIGSRYVKGGRSKAGKVSILMSLILNTIYRIVLKIDARDLSTNYRIYYAEQLKRLRLDSVNYDVLEEILIKLEPKYGRKLKIGEVPITLKKRMNGQSKRKLIPFIISYIKTLFRLIRIKREKTYDEA